VTSISSTGLRTAPARGPHYDVLVVGAGFSGSVMAERAASQGLSVLMVDKRDHIAGNAYDEIDAAGVLIHRYGPHIFHTNSDKVSGYLSRFTEWHPYEHRVLATVGDQQVPVPINRTTINALHHQSLDSDAAAEAYLAGLAETKERTENSEDAVVGKVGRGYTRKQWALDPSELDASVCARIPVRHNTDDRYFTDSFQFMPSLGYTRMFERMHDHPLITVRVGVDFTDIPDNISYGLLVWTGPIDAYFDYRLGKLPYRSLTFRTESHDTRDGGLLQPVGQVNFPGEDVDYTRITEFRHLTGQESYKTTIAYEYPCAEGDPYYPIPRQQNRDLYKQYVQLAERERDVVFVGRLARYQYLNMDQVVAQALVAAREAFGTAADVPAPGSTVARAA
jgi:UDP-galactopyranose mutase